MKLLIFEGIATSGKSTLIKNLHTTLSDHLDVRVASEEETHIPIMHATDKLHIDFFENLIDKLISQNPDVLIVDRFYLTQAFRAKATLAAYAQIESKLQAFTPLTVFLKVEPSAIAERIQKAALHRDPAWGNYVATKGNTSEERASYYINQQESQLALLAQSSLPYIVLDTTSHNYTELTNQIISAAHLA